jgi:hypothetical protein
VIALKESVLPRHLISMQMVLAVVEGVFHKHGASSSELARYSGKSEAYTDSAVLVARQLGMIYKLDEGGYAVTQECKGDLEGVSTVAKEVFRKYLQRYQPFLSFMTFVTRGNTSDDAARKVSVIYSFGEKSEFIRKLFERWGIAIGVLGKDPRKGVVPLVSQVEIDTEQVERIRKALDSEISAKIYLSERLGDEAFKYLHHDEIEELTTAIQKFPNDMRAAIESAGRAYEDFLRRLAQDHRVSVSKRRGIIEVANALRATSKGIELIHDKHLRMSHFIGTIRTAAAHSKEAKTMERWELTPEAALEVVLVTLSAIRSVYSYVKHGTLTF